MKCIKEGRKDRHHGVQIARLALIAAMQVDSLDAAGCSSIWARAWAYLGNAQRLSFELENAAKSFRHSEDLIPDESESTLVGEILYLKTAFLWYKGKIEAGLHSAQKAIDLLGQGTDIELFGAAVILRGILFRASGNMDSAISEYSRALEILPAQPVSELRWSASYNLALCYWKFGAHEQAKELMSDLSRSSIREHPLHSLYIERFEGRVAISERRYTDAVHLLTKTRLNFRRIGSKISAFVGLDLAIAHLCVGQTEPARRFVVEALPVLDIWRKNPGFEEAYNRLAVAIENQDLPVDELTAVRDLCDSLELNPSARAELKLKGLV